MPDLRRGGGRPRRLCPDCFTRTAFIGEPCCGACACVANARQGGRERLCQACRLAPPPWGQARGALRYDAQARRLVLPLKYSDRVELADALAPWMARAGTAMLRAAEVIVPVPLHRRRLFSRRYNQAALLAGALARLTGRPSVPTRCGGCGRRGRWANCPPRRGRRRWQARSPCGRIG